jgi:hypothetical protein
MKHFLGAWFFVAGLAAIGCGDNSNVVGNLFPDGGRGGTGGSFVDTSVGGSTGATTGGSGGSAGTGSSGGSAGTGGNAGTGGSGGSTGAGGSQVENPFPCLNPMPLTTPPGGYVRCSNGMVHRPEKMQCPESIPRSQVLNDGGAPCSKDSDCQAQPHGYCQYWSGLAGSGYACVYGCVKDDECAAGQICLCGTLTGSCVSTGGCTVDADCGGALMCVGYYEICERTRFACQSLEDRCGGSLDCAGTNCAGGCDCQKSGTKASCMPRCVATP